MDRIDKVGLEIGNYNGFIFNPYNFIYENYEDVTTSELVEFLKFISVHNRDVINSSKDKVARLREELSCETVIPVIPLKKDVKSVEKSDDRVSIKNVSDIVDRLFFCESREEMITVMSNSIELKVLVKLEVLKRIRKLEKDILIAVRRNPLVKISDLQDELQRYVVVLEYLKEEKQVKEKDESITFNNIVFVPNGKGLYITQDVSEFEERYKEIKSIIDKIIDGYFLRTKDIKKIESYKNLYEYKHPNGIRVLFVIEGSVINVCSLFFKDKQRSIRISNEYEEAISRYLTSREYITSNLNNPDFIIEQSELIGNLYSLFDGRLMSKKGGE